MGNNVIGKIPEFTTDDPQVAPSEAVPESGAKPADAGGETETPSTPPVETKPAETIGDDITQLKDQLAHQVEGLREDRKQLIHELEMLRGERRELKQQEITKLDQQIDDLKDLHPNDVSTIERILRAKGYVSNQEVGKMFYEARKQEEIQKFLGEFREYTDENDPERKKFEPLLKELSLYKEPSDPTQWGVLLRRAHRAIHGGTQTQAQNPAIAKRQVNIAGVGAGGTQRTPSGKTFDPRKRLLLEQGGWSEDDIKRMEDSL